MEDLQDIFNISWHIISVVAAIFVINKENENSAYKIAWIMPMCIFPIVFFCIAVFRLWGYYSKQGNSQTKQQDGAV